MSTTSMYLGGIGGKVTLPYTGVINVPANGIVTIDTRDIVTVLAEGGQLNRAIGRLLAVSAPLAATAGKFVASTAMSNGTKSIANQPDVPRQAQLVVAPGTSGITAGNASISYYDNSMTLRTDTFSLIMPATTIASTALSYGVSFFETGLIVAGVSGGASPGIQIDSTGALAMSVDNNFTNFNVVADWLNAASVTVGTVASTSACYTPTSAPNGTKNYSFGYTYSAP